MNEKEEEEMVAKRRTRRRMPALTSPGAGFGPSSLTRAATTSKKGGTNVASSTLNWTTPKSPSMAFPALPG